MPPSRIPRTAPKPPADRTSAWVAVGDRLHPADAPVLRADDRGFLYGDGVFETIRALDGAPRHLDRHLDRLERSLASLAIPAVDRAALAGRIDALLTANGLRAGEAAIRISISRGPGGGPRPDADGGGPPTVVISARRLGPAFARRRAGVKLRVVPGGRALAGLKSLCYLPAVLALTAVAPDEEPLFVADDGAVLEGATCNVFARFGQRLCTPPAEGHLLPGVARGLLLERAGRLGLVAEARRLTMGDLARADEVMVTNALLPVAPVSALDGTARSPGDASALARLLTDEGAP